MPIPPKSRLKSAVQKVFMLDAQGGYAGEFVVQDDCVLEFGDFLAALPPQGLGDGQSIFIGEYRATALNGDRMSLVAISKGPVQNEELAWARAAFAATEGHLGGEGGSAPAAGPDKAVLESLAQALGKREEQLADREHALEDKALAMTRELEAREAAKEKELQELRTRLADAVAQRDAVKAEMGKLAQAPGDTSLAADRKQFEKDRKTLQRRALEVLDQAEKVRDKELALAEDRKNIQEARKEVDALLAKIEAAKRPAPEVDLDAAKREVDQRVKILQEKALDLLDREEKLRRREAEAQGVATSLAPANP